MLAGEPPNISQISAVLLSWNKIWTPIKYGAIFSMIINSLHCEDYLYTDDQHLWRWTRRKREGYSNMTEALRKNCQGYTLDKNCRFIAEPETKTVNINDLIAILKSKDESLLTKNAWMFEGE
jgi:hypothetical protein